MPPPGGRCNKREKNGGKQTCCSWPGERDLDDKGLTFLTVTKSVQGEAASGKKKINKNIFFTVFNKVGQ